MNAVDKFAIFMLGLGLVGGLMIGAVLAVVAGLR